MAAPNYGRDFIGGLQAGRDLFIDKPRQARHQNQRMGLAQDANRRANQNMEWKAEDRQLTADQREGKQVSQTIHTAMFDENDRRKEPEEFTEADKQALIGGINSRSFQDWRERHSITGEIKDGGFTPEGEVWMAFDKGDGQLAGHVVDTDTFYDDVVHEAIKINPDYAELQREAQQRRQRVDDLDTVTGGGPGRASLEGLSGGQPQGQPQGQAQGQPARPSNGLIQSESGGNFRAQNDAVGHGGRRGHFGRIQFGAARFDEAKAAGVVPADMTPQEFLDDEQTQMAAEEWHFADIDREIEQRDLARFEGTEVQGVPVTREGMRNVAHLGGRQGLEDFLTSGGEYNPSDENDTSLLDYLEMGAAEANGTQAYGPGAQSEIPAAGPIPETPSEKREVRLEDLDGQIHGLGSALDRAYQGGELEVQGQNMEGLNPQPMDGPAPREVSDVRGASPSAGEPIPGRREERDDRSGLDRARDGLRDFIVPPRKVAAEEAAAREGQAPQGGGPQDEQIEAATQQVLQMGRGEGGLQQEEERRDLSGRDPAGAPNTTHGVSMTAKEHNALRRMAENNQITDEQFARYKRTGSLFEQETAGTGRWEHIRGDIWGSPDGDVVPQNVMLEQLGYGADAGGSGDPKKDMALQTQAEERFINVVGLEEAPVFEQRRALGLFRTAAIASGHSLQDFMDNGPGSQLAQDAYAIQRAMEDSRGGRLGLGKKERHRSMTMAIQIAMAGGTKDNHQKYRDLVESRFHAPLQSAAGGEGLTPEQVDRYSGVIIQMTESFGIPLEVAQRAVIEEGRESNWSVSEIERFQRTFVESMRLMRQREQ